MTRSSVGFVLAAHKATVAVMLTAVVACGTAASMTEHMTPFELVDRLRAHPPRSAADLSEATGVELLTPPGMPRVAEARGASAKRGIEYSGVEFRSIPAGGALIILKLSKPDVARDVVLDRYAPLDITDVPRGRSLDEETYYSRRERWGTISFGFTERQRERLSTIVLKLDATAQ